jgi:hypothetical protein
VNLCFGRAFGLAFDAGRARPRLSRDRFAARDADFGLALAFAVVALAFAVFALGISASLMPPSLP